jgi:1-acyl-sn-glycerol-3-phosphate acyltransferase
MIRTVILLLYLTVVILLGGPLLILYGICGGNMDTFYHVGVYWALLLIRPLGIRTRIEGVENIPPGPCVFASNHASNSDPPVILKAIPRRIGVLIKKSVFSVPFMGKAFRMARFVPVDRDNRGGAMNSIHVAAGYMKEGLSFLMFPEGTRSKDGRLLPFKRAGFVLAIEAGVPVVPIACSGAQHILPKGSVRLRAGEIVVRFCPPINAAAYSMDRRGELAADVHDVIAANLPPEQKPLSARSSG